MVNPDESRTVGQLVARVEAAEAFSAWRKTNKSACLSSVFVMVSDAAQLEQPELQGNEWLVSYYDKADDTFTTFSSLGFQKGEKEEAFKKERALPPLVLGAVKVEAGTAIAIAEKVRIGDYKGEGVSRVILVLQPLTGDEISDSGGKDVETVWNITYITSSFNVLNVKLSAETGKVLKHGISGVMDFMQKDK